MNFDKDNLEDLIKRLRKDLADFGGLTANRLYLLNEMKEAIKEIK